MTHTFTKTESWTRFSQAKLASATALQHLFIAAGHPTITDEELERVSSTASDALVQWKRIQNEMVSSPAAEPLVAESYASLQDLPIEQLAEQARALGTLSTYTIGHDVTLVLDKESMRLTRKQARAFLMGLISGFEMTTSG